MSIIDLIILLILFVSVAFGFYRGSIASVLGLSACLLSLLCAFWLGPRLASLLGSNRGVTELLITYTDAGSLVGDYSLATTQVSGMSTAAIQTVLKSVSLPDSIAAILESNLMHAVFAPSGMTTVNDYVSYTIVAVVLQSVSFVVCFFLSFVLFHMVISLIGHVFPYPVLHHLDGLAGGVFGLLRGVLVLYVLFLLVPVLNTVIPLDLLEQYLGPGKLSEIFSSASFFTRIATGS